MNLSDVPVEVMQYLVYELGILSALDILALCLTCKWLKDALRKSEFDLDQHRATTKLDFCLENGWARGARLSLSRGLSKPRPWHLWQALQPNVVSVLQMLLADPRLVVCEQDTGLIANAVETGSVEVVAVLLNDGRVLPQVENLVPLWRAVRMGFVDIVKLLMSDPRVDPCMRNNTAVRLAAKHGHAEVLAALLADPRVNPGDQENEALSLAILGHHVDVAKLLLADSRFDPSAYDFCWLSVAAQEGSLKMFNVIHADPRIIPMDMIVTFAVKGKNADIVRAVLADPRVDPGALPLFHNILYEYPVVAAVKRQNLEILRLLVEDGRADLRVDDSLSTAALFGNLKMVELLLRDSRISVTQEALDAARWKGHKRIQELLLQHKLTMTLP
jgi:hypothetical protein